MKSYLPHSVNFTVVETTNWSEITKWINKNKTGNWGWFPGKFKHEEDKVKFILRWL